MTIASLAPIGVGIASQMLSQMLGQVQGASSTTSSGSADQEFSVAPAASTPTTSTASTTPAVSTISDQVLGFLVSLQNEAESAAQSASASGVQSATNAIQNPLSQAFSAVDTNGDGTISESELENFVEGQSGTQSAADALYAGLTQNGTQSLTQPQLASDVQNAGTQALNAVFGETDNAAASASNATTAGNGTMGGSSVLLSLLNSLTQSLPGVSSAGIMG